MSQPTRPVRRYLRADLKCCNCSRIAGEIAAPAVQASARRALTPVYFRPVDGAWRIGVPAAQWRCPRCAGRLLLDEIEYHARRLDARPPWAQAAETQCPPRASDTVA
jgi:hypothetical protein